jgi:GNAT superfamily N-acetyltransferase
MSLYAEYVKERLGDSIIETEHGFATYRYIEPKSVYIVDLYVVPSQRKYGKASAIADKIVEMALSQGCNKLIGTVMASAKTATLSIQVLIGYGMQLVSSNNEFLVFEKDI